MKNPYLTESIDVIQTLFDEDEEMEEKEEEEEEIEEEEVDEYVGGAEEEVRKIGHEQGVKQHMLLQTGAQYKYTAGTSLHTHSGPGRKRKVVL